MNKYWSEKVKIIYSTKHYPHLHYNIASVSIQVCRKIFCIFFMNLRKPQINNIEIFQVWKYTKYQNVSQKIIQIVEALKKIFEKEQKDI